MEDQKTCPKCGNTDLHRDSVDVGVGVIYGPLGCSCGWSEDDCYDLDKDGGVQDDGSYLDQWGTLYPAANPVARLMLANKMQEKQP